MSFILFSLILSKVVDGSHDFALFNLFSNQKGVSAVQQGGTAAGQPWGSCGKDGTMGLSVFKC